MLSLADGTFPERICRADFAAPASRGTRKLSHRKTNQQLWLVPRTGESQSGLLVEVAVCLPTYSKYSYAAPPELADRLAPGVAVRVPYGRAGRVVDGFVTSVATHDYQQTLRPIDSVSDETSILTPELVQLAEWVADYYVHPPGLVLESLVPRLVRDRGLRRARIVRLEPLREAAGAKNSPKRQLVREALAAGEIEVSALRERTGASAALLRKMEADGLIHVQVKNVPVDDSLSDVPPAIEMVECLEDRFHLTVDQQGALDQIVRAATIERSFCAQVLFGVPGSGKTEVYVRAIRAVIAAGRQALLIVPEIALVTQLIERLARRFANVAVLHGALAPRLRRESLLAVRSGAAQVVIGTRTAAFAPCSNLGLIVVDEEQESSLKNIAAPYYHARDVAIKRAQLANIPIVLGSATPALETWHNAHTLPHYRLLRLSSRVPGATLPKARLVRNEPPPEGGPPPLLSEILRTAIRRRLESKEQVILLQNRRGYAPFLRCEKCHLTIRCDRCGLHLIYHRVNNLLRCHHCGRSRQVPPHCLDDTCRGRLLHLGPGIQRVEEELSRAFPQARVLRLDRDTMRRPQDYRAALAGFERGEADILIGTQMVAKGLDFPRVSLVGILDADGMLAQPDVRAAERAFQLLMQTIGRAGRQSGASEAFVQCEQPNQFVLEAAVRLDFEGFAANELDLRKALNDPPFTRLCRIVLSDPSLSRVKKAAQELAQRLGEGAGRIHAGITIDEARPTALPMVRGLHRWQVMIRAARGGLTQQLLASLRSEKRLPRGLARYKVDIDCLDLS